MALRTRMSHYIIEDFKRMNPSVNINKSSSMNFYFNVKDYADKITNWILSTYKKYIIISISLIVLIVAIGITIFTYSYISNKIEILIQKEADLRFYQEKIYYNSKLIWLEEKMKQLDAHSVTIFYQYPSVKKYYDPVHRKYISVKRNQIFKD